MSGYKDKQEIWEDKTCGKWVAKHAQRLRKQINIRGNSRLPEKAKKRHQEKLGGHSASHFFESLVNISSPFPGEAEKKKKKVAASVGAVSIRPS